MNKATETNAPALSGAAVEQSWSDAIGTSAYASIVEMVDALNCDYDRLAELKAEHQSLVDALTTVSEEYAEAIDNVKRHHRGYVSQDENYPEVREMIELKKAAADAASEFEDWDRKELADLESAAGECESQDEARERIHEDALSVEVRSDWYTPGRSAEDNAPSEFRILLCTGGPAVQIRGELSSHGEPDRAWLEVQDWGKPWTQYFKADPDVLLDYARCFYFGEG